MISICIISKHPWVSWHSTVGQTSITLHSSSVDQLGEYSWSHFCYSSLITRGSAGRAQLVTLLLLSTHNPWISWQSTYCHISVTFHSPPVDQLAEHSLSHFASLHSSPVDQLAEYSWSDFCYSPLITGGSAGRVQLVTLL